MLVPLRNCHNLEIDRVRVLCMHISRALGNDKTTLRDVTMGVSTPVGEHVMSVVCQNVNFRPAVEIQGWFTKSRPPTFVSGSTPLYFAYFELGEMRSAHTQRQVEIRRLCNQLPVLCKANSLCKIVKLCVLCLFYIVRAA